MNDDLDDIDALLRDDLLQPPADFAERVMRRLPLQPVARQVFPRVDVWRRMRWLAARAGLVGGGVLGFLLGLDQLAAFVFGLWLSGAAL
jgi:hypothetical protein